MCFGNPGLEGPGWEEISQALVDPEVGLCAHSARFTRADVVEHICALSGGRLEVEEITALADRFLASDLAVRLTPDDQPGRRRAPQVVDRRAPGDGGPHPGPGRRPGRPDGPGHQRLGGRGSAAVGARIGSGSGGGGHDVDR